MRFGGVPADEGESIEATVPETARSEVTVL